MKILIALMMCVVAWGQQGAPVQQNKYPYPGPTLLAFDYATGGPQYFCYTAPHPASFSWTRAASTLTSIVDAASTSTVTTSTAHGLSIGNPVVITGATVSTALNGTYVIQTIPSSTTFTITTSGVADATYTESTLVVTTAAPRTTAAIWSISRLVYDSSNNLSAVLWANGNQGTFTQICANRATLSYQ